MRNLRREIHKHIKLYGLIRTLEISVRKSFYFASECIQLWFSKSKRCEFDENFGLDTNGKIPLSSLDIDSENWIYGRQYQPTPPEIFREMLNHLKIEYRDFVFIDFGSGKGRILLLASEFPFKKIIGIEFSAQLHQVAQKNLSTYRSVTQKCMHIESLCLNAVTYPIPKEQAVFYFFNPFKEKVMVEVLANIQSSLANYPRRLFIIYYDPVLSHLFGRFGFVEQIRSEKTYIIYSNP